MLKLDDRLILQPDVLVQEMGEEMVIVLPSSAEFVVLNESGTYLLRQLQDGATTRQLADELSARYAIASEQAEADILAWVSELIISNVCTLMTSKT